MLIGRKPILRRQLYREAMLQQLLQLLVEDLIFPLPTMQVMVQLE